MRNLFKKTKRNFNAFVNYGEDDYLHGNPFHLVCCICGERDRDKLLVEDIGISVGMVVNNYTFCKKCWNSRHLGKNILQIICGRNCLKVNDKFVTYNR